MYFFLYLGSKRARNLRLRKTTKSRLGGGKAMGTQVEWERIRIQKYRFVGQDSLITTQ